MAIEAGKTGTFQATLEDNGVPAPLPAGSTFAWSTDLPDATVSASADTTMGWVTIPASSTATSVTVTAATTDPNGSPVSGSVTTEVVPGVTHTFTVSVVQLAPQQLPAAHAKPASKK